MGEQEMWTHLGGLESVLPALPVVASLSAQVGVLA